MISTPLIYASLAALLLTGCACPQREPDSATDEEIARSLATVYRLREQLWGEQNPTAYPPHGGARTP